jgi:hypothetical protein
MAVNVIQLLTDITLGEAADFGDWNGDTTGAATDAEVFRQGLASFGWPVGKNGNETISFDINSNNGSPMDMSTDGHHLFVTMRCDIAPFIDYIHFGLESVQSDGAANDGVDYWTVIDHTVDIEWAGEWLTIKLDPTNGTKFSTSGTLDLANISHFHINVDNSNSGNIRSITNTFIDAVRFGFGLLVTGTDWNWEDVAFEDNLNANKYDIVRKVGPGVFEVNGRIQIGSGPTTTTCISANETLFFKDISTSGIEGGPIGNQKPGYYKITVTGIGVSGFDPSNLAILASANAPFIFDASDSGLPSGSINWVSGTIIQCTSFLSDGDQIFDGLSFFDCGQIDPSTSSFINFLIDNYLGTDGAILWGGGTGTKNGTVQNSDRGIEITQITNQDFDNLKFLSNTYDVHLNNGGTDIDVSKTNGSNPVTQIATGGGVVTFVGSSVTISTYAILTSGAEVVDVMCFLRAKDDTGPFPFQEVVNGIVNTGTLAVVDHTAHGMASGDYVEIKGASHPENNLSVPITVNTADEYEYTMQFAPGSSPTGTITSTFVALKGLTLGTGLKEVTRVYPANQPVIGWARKTTASPFYKTFPIVGVVDTALGFTPTAVMISDE